MNDCQNNPQGTLFIVSTPIGNLEDITLRALRVLKGVALIAAEDTRHTRKLLSTYAIETPTTSLYEQNERDKSQYLVSRLREGQDVAYVSDAGTPGISDPGYLLIHAAIAAGIRVVPVPGVSAAVAALSVSGLPMDSFVFFAFLPHTEGKKRNFFQTLQGETRTMVFYESPRRLLPTLVAIRDIFGGDRQVVVARELTKIYEELVRAPVGEAIRYFEGNEVKGELTLLLAGGKKTAKIPEEIFRARFEELSKDQQRSTKDIVDILTEETELARKDIYKKVLEWTKELSN